jgi:hypothetical protein
MHQSRTRRCSHDEVVKYRVETRVVVCKRTGVSRGLKVLSEEHRRRAVKLAGLVVDVPVVVQGT